MPLPDFKSSEPYTLGIELELQVVNPPGYDLSGLLCPHRRRQRRHQRGEVKHDITESMLEIATGVCQTIDRGSAVLGDAAEHPARGGGASHPDLRRRNAPVPEVAASGGV